MAHALWPLPHNSSAGSPGYFSVVFLVFRVVPRTELRGEPWTPLRMLGGAAPPCALLRLRWPVCMLLCAWPHSPLELGGRCHHHAHDCGWKARHLVQALSVETREGPRVSVAGGRPRHLETPGKRPVSSPMALAGAPRIWPARSGAWRPVVPPSAPVSDRPEAVALSTWFPASSRRVPAEDGAQA